MPVYKFSPNLASAKERLETFVARDAILKDLLDRVRNMESGARHCILIGPRGMGKTHLLLLLADKIEADEALAPKWSVVRFAEEEYSITSLAELLLKVVQSLPNGKSEEIGRDADLALGHIRDYCAASGKRILLLMDNMQLYFQQFTDTDIGRLRDILTSDSTFLIIGAAPSYFKQMTGYEESFYNFFEPIHLGELTPEEVGKMLRRRGEFEKEEDFLKELDTCRPKIEAVTRLTGGNPRLILMLYQVMCEANIEDAAEAFKRLLDELTPYFQGRMDGLPPQGRKVLDTLASMGSPSTPTELAEAAGMQVNAVTSQLKRLKDSGFVQQIKRRRSKETRYEVTERLFRMWREMRTETGRTRLRFIVRFLELWYTPIQLLNETEKLLAQLEEAQEYERPQLVMHVQYLIEAIPERLRPYLGEIDSHYIDDGFLFKMAIKATKTEVATLKEFGSCDEAVKANPDDARAWRDRGIALSQLERYQEAVESLNKAIELKPDFADAWLDRGSALFFLERYKEALKNCDRAVQLKPDLATAWLERGHVLDSLDKHEDALESYNKALQIRSNLTEAWESRGHLLEELERYEEALESYDKVIQLQPDSENAWVQRGHILLYRLDRYAEALESFDRAIQLEPDHEIIAGTNWHYRASALTELGRYEEALESYNRSNQLIPYNPFLREERGVLLAKLGRYEEALEDFNEEVMIPAPMVHTFFYNRGIILGKLDRHEEALDRFDIAIEHNPSFAPAWFARGTALEDLDRYEEALESFDKGIQIQPNDLSAWNNRGIILGRLGRDEEAVESFNKATQLQPDSAIAWTNRGFSLYKLSRYQEAIESHNRAIKLQPDLAEAWRNRGWTLSNMGEYKKALENYDKAIQLQPDDADNWHDRGWALGRLGRHDEALETYDKVIQLEPDNAMAWDNRGLTLFHLGRNDEALESLKKAVELAKAQNLKDAAKFAALLAAETEFLASLESLKEDNLGTARRVLKNAMKNGEQTLADDLQEAIFGYLKGAIRTGKIQFVQEAIEIVVSELGGDYGELLRPFSIALEYMQTEDESILERLQQEVRELVLEICSLREKESNQ